MTISTKRLLQASRTTTDQQVASTLRSRGVTSEFDRAIFEESSSLGPLQDSPAKKKVIMDRLGESPEMEYLDPDAETLLSQMYSLLPVNLPPSIAHPLAYYLAVIVEGRVDSRPWVYTEEPIEGLPVGVADLLRLHIISSEVLRYPWYLAIISRCAYEWGAGGIDIDSFWSRVREEVVGSINLLGSARVVRILNSIMMAPLIGAPKMGMIRRYLEVSTEKPTTLHYVIASAVREILTPSFSALGIRRGFISDKDFKRRKDVHEVMRIDVAYGARATMCHALVREDVEIPEGFQEVDSLRISLRTQLCMNQYWRTESFMEGDYEPASPTDEMGWLIHEEPEWSKKAIHLTPTQVQVLGAGWAGLGLARTRERILEHLGVNRKTAQGFARNFLKDGVVSVGFLPRLDLIQLTGAMFVHLEGDKQDLLRFRSYMESGLPYVESSMGVDGRSFFALVGLPRDIPQTVSIYVEAGLGPFGLKAVHAVPARNIRRQHMRGVMRCLS